MTQLKHWRAGALAGLTLALAACGRTSSPLSGSASAPPQKSVVSQASTAGQADWRDQIIYFALTDRFANGDPRNDDGASRTAGDRADRANPLGWHGGDLAGIRKKIEEGYFQKMGFTAIWISPVVLQVPDIPVNSGPNTGQRFAGYHGYWADDFFKTDPHFGSLSDLKALVDMAHKHKLRIIQDVVVNHAGYGSALVSQHPDWFHTDADCAASGDKDQDCALAGLPDFKQDVPAVTRYLNDFINYWTKATGVDGLRMDTMKHVSDGYWKQFFAAGGPGDPKKIWTVGEVFNGDPAFLAKYLDQIGSPSVFDFALYFGMKDNLSSARGSLDSVAGVFARDSAYQNPGRLTTFVDNHDVKRFVNEATDRGSTTAQAGERLDLALSLIYMARGLPSVYQGTEIAQPGGGDPYDYPLGGGNREDMDFGKVGGSPLAARLTALAGARRQYLALTRGAQQELWRPNGGAPIYAFRRVTAERRSGVSSDPVVTVMNNGDSDLDLATLPGGGIGLYGTFSGDTLKAYALKEITGRTSNLRVQGGKLVGTVPARTLLAVSAPAGTGGAVSVNPNLGNVTQLAARAGDGAVKLSWTAPSDAGVTGYRVYQRVSGGSYTLLNFAPLARSATSVLAPGLTNGVNYDFKVVSVDASGAESGGTTVSATPSASNTVGVTFTVDARSQGNGVVELRRFDTGSQLVYPMTQASAGIWKTTIDLPLFHEVKFKFGNSAPGAKNSGYEGPNQSDRSFTPGDANSYEGVYDFISVPVPASSVSGKVTSGGVALPGALVQSDLNPALNYAFTFADGSYFLPTSAASQQLSASKANYAASAPQTVTAPAQDVNFDLRSSTPVGKYLLDGDLSDWSSTHAVLSSPAEGTFGPDNNLLALHADYDDQYLYLAYTAKNEASNPVMLYLDTKDGGASAADGFVGDASGLAKWATFARPIDALIARFGTEAAQLWQVSSGTDASRVANTAFSQGSNDAGAAKTVEMAIPWASLGFSGRPTTTLGIYGGVFGGNLYGAGDIAPDAGSTPAGDSTITDCYNTCTANFKTPFSVDVR